MATPPEELRRTVSHEAGHAAISVHLGLRFHPIKIHDAGMYDGSVEPDLSGEDSENKSRVDEIARKQVIVAYAGAEAQRMLHPDQPESEIAASAEDDHCKIRNIAEECKLSSADLEHAKQEAALLVEQFRDAIQAIAEVLWRNRRLTYAEAKEIYEARLK
jgi:hypothetical protein